MDHIMSEILQHILEKQDVLYATCGLIITGFAAEGESAEYYAHSYQVNGKKIRFRIAKKTPTKTGWFVAIWKRNAQGITVPYDSGDAVDFFVITIIDQGKVGQFIFPKSLLVEKNIFATSKKDGKRGIRVYSPWDATESVQAAKTKAWQSIYFVDITSDNAVTRHRIKELYSER